jgi:RNA polymerase sigma factor (sigma-70 family)
MASRQTSTLMQHLRRVALLGDGAGLSDGQLLSYFLDQQDDAAFAALVRRHGAMVWGVCHRVLRNVHDAEDAFQATFLVLARKAASVLPREKVGNWLYGVAFTTAQRAKVTAAKRRLRERQVMDMPEPPARPADLWSELQPVLDAELSLLPDKYRYPIILCDLEGKTRKQAARQLGVPDGTVAGRLARARVLLAKRLARRGVALSGGVLATLLAQNAAAKMPTSLIATTARAARLLTAGQGAAAGVLTANVIALMEGVLKVMFLTKIRTILVLLVIMGVLGLGVALSARGVQVDQPVNENKPAAVKSAPAPKPLSAQKGPQKKTVYALECPIVEGVNGEDDLGPGGKGKCSCVRLAVPEREEASFVLDDDFFAPSPPVIIPTAPVSPARSTRDRTDVKDIEQCIKPGLSACFKVISLKDGLVRLDAKVQLNKIDRADKDNVQISGTCVRAICAVKLDQDVKLVIDKDDWGEPRIWARIKVRKLEPALPGTEVLSNPPEPLPRKNSAAGRVGP